MPHHDYVKTLSTTVYLFIGLRYLQKPYFTKTPVINKYEDNDHDT